MAMDLKWLYQFFVSYTDLEKKANTASTHDNIDHRLIINILRSRLIKSSFLLPWRIAET